MFRTILRLSMCIGAIVLTLALLVFWGCSKSEKTSQSNALRPAATQELVIYSARKEKYIKPITDKFQKETGIKVKVLAGDDTIVSKVLVEKNNVHADIFFSTDIGALEYLRVNGALMPYAAPGAKLIYKKYQSSDNSWFPLGARCRVLMYNKDLITEEEMPHTFFELTDPKWKGQYMIPRAGNGSMVAHITALRTLWGDEKTKQWVQTLAENAGAITKDHAAIRTAIGAGEYKFGIVNDNYFYEQLMEEKNNNVGIIYTDQAPDETGVFVNVSGVSIIKGAPNLANAKAFIDFMLQPEQLTVYSETSAELPVSSAVAPQEFKGLLQLGEFKEMQVSFSKIGYAWHDVRNLMEEAGLDMTVK